MDETFTSATNGPDGDAPVRSRLSFDLDVDICVVGAGLAGLTVALEAARLGASVAVLEGRHVGWNASGHQLGTVMPGYGLPLGELIERVGLEDAREFWSLSKQGAEYVRAKATEEPMPGIALTEGALEVSNVEAGDTLISRLQMLGEDFDTEVEGWQVDRVRGQLKTSVISTASITQKRFRSTAANMSMASPRWRGGQGRGFSRIRRSSASILRAFASGSSRRRHGCAHRISCSPATSISARRCGGCRKRCCRSGAMPR